MNVPWPLATFPLCFDILSYNSPSFSFNGYSHCKTTILESKQNYSCGHLFMVNTQFQPTLLNRLQPRSKRQLQVHIIF